MFKKKIEHICGNCKLFNPSCRQCAVIVLYEGKKVRLPVDAEDSCFFEEEYYDPITKTKETFNEIQQVRLWAEDAEGRPTDGKGTIKIEFPRGFFGETEENLEDKKDLTPDIVTDLSPDNLPVCWKVADQKRNKKRSK